MSDVICEMTVSRKTILLTFSNSQKTQKQEQPFPYILQRFCENSSLEQVPEECFRLRCRRGVWIKYLKAIC